LWIALPSVCNSEALRLRLGRAFMLWSL